MSENDEVVSQLKAIDSSLTWIAVWLFCIWLSSCGTDRVKVISDVVTVERLEPSDD